MQVCVESQGSPHAFMLLTLILLSGAVGSSEEERTVTVPPVVSSPEFAMWEQIANGAFSAVEPSSDLPVRQCFLAEDLDEWDEEREQAHALSDFPGASSSPHVVPPSAAGSCDRTGLAPASRHASPLLQSVWLRC